MSRSASRSELIGLLTSFRSWNWVTSWELGARTPYGITQLAAWRSGKRRSSHERINARRARLVPGWVTVFGRVCHLGM